MMGRILVALELAPSGESKLPVVERYARALNTRVVLLHVLPPAAVDPEEVLPSEAMARAYLDTVAAQLAAKHVQSETEVRSGTLADTILDEARVQQAELIVLGNSPRPRLARVVIGSLADQVVPDAPCPVLLIGQAAPTTGESPLRSFDEDATRAAALVRRDLGVRTVEVARIIGTVGRARELGPNFRPLQRRRADDERFARILRAMQRGEELPPVELYKIGFGYYVLDGHHRVAAAKALRQREIDAHVTEFLPLGDPKAARTFAERRAFEQSTGLTNVGATRPETYGELAEQIHAYRQQQGLKDYRDAAQGWYGDVYRPLWQKVRRLRLARSFPGERSADVIARLGAWRKEHAGADGSLPDWDEVLDRFRARLATAKKRAHLIHLPRPRLDWHPRPRRPAR
jgi:nucleotide-binding universal stress UspA family protein